MRPSDNPNPTSRWLLLGAERHGPDEHLAFAQDVAAAMHRAGATASAVAVVEHLLRYPEEDQESLQQLDRLTQGEGWQDARVELPQFHVLPTSLAAARGNARSLRLLLERGALVAWPEDAHTDWDDVIAVNGSPEQAYIGVYPLPLVETARRAALVDKSAPEFFQALELLEAHGADPTAPDPATGRNAIEAVVNAIDGTGAEAWCWVLGDDMDTLWVPVWRRWCERDVGLKQRIQDQALEGGLAVLEETGLGKRLRAVWFEQRLDQDLPPGKPGRGPRM